MFSLRCSVLFDQHRSATLAAFGCAVGRGCIRPVTDCRPTNRVDLARDPLSNHILGLEW